MLDMLCVDNTPGVDRDAPGPTYGTFSERVPAPRVQNVPGLRAGAAVFRTCPEDASGVGVPKRAVVLLTPWGV